MARQYIVPGRGYVNADGTKEYIVPGAGYVNVNEGGGPTYTLTAATGVFTLTGNAAGLRVSRKITAGTGSFTLTGNAAGLIAGRKLSAATGSFTLTGNSVNLVYTPIGGPTYTLAAGTGSFVLTGNAAGLRVSRKITIGTGAFVLTGNPVNLVYTPVGGGPSYASNKNIHIDSVGGMVLQLGTGRVPSWNTAGRPAAPDLCTIGYNSQTDDLELWNGTAWKTVALV